MRLFIKTLFISLVIAGISSGQKREAEVVRKIDGDDVYKLLEPDGIPAIRNPRYVKGDSAAQQMMDNEPVIGVSFNGVNRAYSLWQLDHHEVVNDYFDETPVGVTW